MPPINQQGSRATLMTALVIFTILFVVSSVFAIQFYGNWQKEVAQHKSDESKYKDVIPVDQAKLTEMLSARADPDTLKAFNKITERDSALDVALKERDGLIAIITGVSTTKATDAANAAAKAVVDAQDILRQHKVTTFTLATTGGLAKSFVGMAQAAGASQDAVVNAKADVASRDADVAAKTQENETLKDADAKALKAAQEDGATALAKAQQDVADKDATFKSLQDSQKSASDTSAADTQKAADELVKANQTIKQLNSQVVAFQGRLARNRGDVINPMVRKADGKIIRVPNKEVCYINLGTGSQVTPGLTFEVYDKAQGVPPITDNGTGDEQLPVGKASIEITRVDSTSSECRIVSITPGAIISEGDVIKNLVYDPNTKYNFFVYGKFDLAGNGRANDPDAAVMKRLVTQWGGKLTDQIDVNTDFVVMGSEPVVPTFSKDDETAENQDKQQKAQDELNKYQDLVAQAKQLNIPIMNQNRFLYYVGFYDQAKR